MLLSAYTNSYLSLLGKQFARCRILRNPSELTFFLNSENHLLRNGHAARLCVQAVIRYPICTQEMGRMILEPLLSKQEVANWYAKLTE